MNRKKQILAFFALVLIFCFIIFGISENPLITVSVMVLFSSSLTFIFNVATKEYSWTDRLWSTLPVLMAWVYYLKTHNSILLFTAMIITCWGIRLTFNFYRKGGYTSKEDYRWAYLQTKITSPVLWQIFNFLFISIYQQLLFILFTLPLYLMALKDSKATNLTYLFFILAILFLILETVADQQQWVFQESKYGRRSKIDKLNKSYEQGFRTSGLFSISRHPNYLGELGFWFSIYLITSSAYGTYINWTIIGPILLLLLFMGSVVVTEGITKEKYSKYENYKKQVPALVPLPLKRIK